jgi:hypothetical protein
MKIEDFVRRADQVLELGKRAAASERHTDYGDYLDRAIFAEFRAAGLSFLRNTFGEAHPYYSDFDQKAKENDIYNAERGFGILTAARSEVAGGWFVSTRSLVSAEIFADFLEMAEHLLGEGYKDAAAVMIGGVLEEHLRQLAVKQGVPVTLVRDGKDVPKKADALNSELSASNAYGKLEQKMITAWLDLRNKAAHGRYSEYTAEQVQLMADGVTLFMVQVPVK